MTCYNSLVTQSWSGCRIRQIIINLLSNAIKFSMGGEIVVTAAATDKDNQKAEVQISVKVCEERTWISGVSHC
jgi:signal transduction histidine kinase